MKACELYDKIMLGHADASLRELYGADGTALEKYRTRTGQAVKRFSELYGNREAMLFSVGGRSEISGNHTDHNCGRVLCAAVDLDIIAVASPTDDGVITVKSEGFEADTVFPADIEEPCEKKYFTSEAIIAGMEKAFVDRGFKVGGFVAYTVSDVFKGSGLSSSAAFEVMIGNILNHMYNGGAVDNVEIAKAAQFAENVYFGKPCGLMDQTACAVGGFTAIDFEDPASPVIEKIDFDLSRNGYGLCIVDTGASHADLNEDYAAVPAEMKAVAKLLGRRVLRECSEEEIIAKASEIRAVEGDRALLRALHFTAENRRVARQTEALKRGDTSAFLEGVLESGRSSFCYLQNVYAPKCTSQQALSLALCLTERFLEGCDAAWRVHGGGFAGTIQAFVPVSFIPEYKKRIEAVFGKNSCHVLKVRAAGAVRII